MTEQSLKKRLDVLVKTGDNRFCADCGKRGVGECGLTNPPNTLIHLSQREHYPVATCRVACVRHDVRVRRARGPHQIVQEDSSSPSIPRSFFVAIALLE